MAYGHGIRLEWRFSMSLNGGLWHNTIWRGDEEI